MAPFVFQIRVATDTAKGAAARLTGRDYLQVFVLPNFYFHVTTAYNILRHYGVDIGKRDFLADMGRFVRT